MIGPLWSEECGDCVFWMTPKCVLEKKYRQFKSCSSVACTNFHDNGIRAFLKSQKEVKDEIRNQTRT